MKRVTGITALTLVFAVTIGGCAAKLNLDADPQAVRAALRTMLTADSSSVLIAERRELARDFYEDREYAPLWIADGPSDRVRALVDAICSAELDGLHPWEYDLAPIRDALRRIDEGEKVSPETIAALELRFTGLFLDYGADLASGRHDPRSVEKDWYIRTPQETVDSILSTALAAASFEEMRAALVPQQEEYASLAEALRRYRAIDSAGGWPSIPAGELVKPGDRDDRAPLVRRRLAITGDLSSGEPVDSVFDAELAGAVAHFQARHGLVVDSLLGENTLAALNVTVADRIGQIELNLERMRWMPRNLGDRYILVNIPEYYLHAYDGGEKVLDMKVVVGEEYGSATPVFSDSMSYVVFRPYWNIPESILSEEILPRAQEDPSYLARNNYEIVKSMADPEPVQLSQVNWSGPEDGSFPYLARQKPGGSNSLGLVKFMFPNRFAIYLHDTPADHLFERSDRALSHGCIRVENPVRLAEFVFSGNDEWNEPQIRRAMNPSSEDNNTVTLERKLPVYILYLTAFTQDGEVHFRNDLYGMDEQAREHIAPDSEQDVAGMCQELRELLKG